MFIVIACWFLVLGFSNVCVILGLHFLASLWASVKIGVPTRKGFGGLGLVARWILSETPRFWYCNFKTLEAQSESQQTESKQHCFGSLPVRV